MTEVFREIDEELRREKYEKLWRRYGQYVVAAALAVVLGIGGWLGLREWRQQQAAASAVQFNAALALAREGKQAEAAQAFAALAAEAPDGYRALAVLQEAAAHARAEQTMEAVAAYDRLAADGGVPAPLRDLGRLLAALHLSRVAPPAEIEQRLQPLAAEGSVWRHSAREILASARLRAGDAAAAREGFRQLADDATAPAGVRARAAEMLAALGS